MTPSLIRWRIRDRARNPPPPLLMLHEAIDGLKASQDAIAHAIALALVRHYGGEGASAMADNIVKQVQHLRRERKRDG